MCACVSLRVRVDAGAVEHHVMQLDKRLQSQVCVCVYVLVCVCVCVLVLVMWSTM